MLSVQCLAMVFLTVQLCGALNDTNTEVPIVNTKFSSQRYNVIAAITGMPEDSSSLSTIQSTNSSESSDSVTTPGSSPSNVDTISTMSQTSNTSTSPFLNESTNFSDDTSVTDNHVTSPNTNSISVTEMTATTSWGLIDSTNATANIFPSEGSNSTYSSVTFPSSIETGISDDTAAATSNSIPTKNNMPTTPAANINTSESLQTSSNRAENVTSTTSEATTGVATSRLSNIMAAIISILLGYKFMLICFV